MDTQIPVSLDALQVFVTQAVSEVFNTMLHVKADFTNAAIPGGETEAAKPLLPSEIAMIAGVVGFLGSINGMVYVYMPEALAKQLTCNMLGLTPDELESEPPETINDSLGEMCNMISGSFKNNLCNQGYDCRLTIPSILRGNNFSIEATSSVFRKLYYFKVENSTFAVDLFIKTGNIESQ